jgi:hypothetical protein
MDSAQVFALHAVFKLHHHLPEHAERSRLSDRWKRRVRGLGTCDLLKSCVFSSGHSDYPKKEQANRRTLSDKQPHPLITPLDVTRCEFAAAMQRSATAAIVERCRVLH